MNFPLDFIPSVLRGMRVFACALILAGACAAEDRPPLVVGTKPDVPPYEYEEASGELAGFCVDVLRATARRQGLRLEFRRLSNQGVWEAFDRGELDLISGAVYSEERTRRMDFTVPLAYIPYLLLVRKGTQGIRSERDLKNQEIFVVQRSPLAAYAAGQGLRTKEFPSYEDCFRELASGKGGAALVPKFTWLRRAQGQPDWGLEAVPTEIYPHRVCFAVQKGRAELLAKLNEGIFALKNSGELDQIYDRHLGSLERSQLPLQTALRKSATLLVPALLAVGFAVHLTWTFALRRLVHRRTADLRAELGRRKAAEAELERTVEQLREALVEVKRLSGLLPICAGCKMIRDDQGQWQPLEGYISANSEATFSHGLCPDCIRTLYPDVPGKPE